MLQHASELPPRLATRRGRRRPLISLTPLIDVVFILLIFFMLASSFLDWRAIDLDTPQAAAAGSPMEGALLIEVRPEGLRLSGESMTLDALAAEIVDRLESEPDRSVLVKPAAGVRLQAAVDVVDRLAAAGISRLSFIRDPGQ